MSNNIRDARHILVVDDDPIMRQMITDYFRDYEMPVKAISIPSRLDPFFAKPRPDLIIMDVQPGQGDGFNLLRAIRARLDIPIIIATGNQVDESDRIAAFNLGADDYIMKPFSLRELLARVRVLLRRQKGTHLKLTHGPKSQVYRFGGWRLERRNRRLSNADGKLVALTNSEYGLLIAFLEAPRQALTREYLLQATRVHADNGNRTIDLWVLRLRRKLETEPSLPRIITTERGVGYVFTLPVEAQ